MAGMSHAPTCVDDHPHDEPAVGDVKVAGRKTATSPAAAPVRFPTGLWSLPEVRWALLATVLFSAGLLLRLAGVPGG